MKRDLPRLFHENPVDADGPPRRRATLPRRSRTVASSSAAREAEEPLTLKAAAAASTTLSLSRRALPLFQICGRDEIYASQLPWRMTNKGFFWIWEQGNDAALNIPTPQLR